MFSLSLSWCITVSPADPRFFDYLPQDNTFVFLWTRYSLFLVELYQSASSVIHSSMHRSGPYSTPSMPGRVLTGYRLRFR